MVIESMHEKTDEAMCKLLQALFRSFVITIDQMKNVSICHNLFDETFSKFLKKQVQITMTFINNEFNISGI